MSTGVIDEQIEQAYACAETWTAEEVLQWAAATFDADTAIASAFGAEGIVTIDIASRIFPQMRVFTLDTGYLFPETHKLMKRIEARYGIQVRRVRASVGTHMQEEIHGPGLWNRDPNQCCQIRKIEPLRNHLAGLRAWITAIRRDQTPTRAAARKVEWDANFGLVKINPLADWTSDMVWDYIHSRDLPYNPLHDHNYPSIGCTHCTRAVCDGEDLRAGRWSGFSKSECGIHQRNE